MNVYDFDKTIYDGDSTRDFILYAYLRKPSLLKQCPKQLWAFVKWRLLKRSTKTQFKEVLFSLFAEIEDMDRYISDFWKKHEGNLKAFYLAQKREDDLIISASPEFLLKPICDKLSVELIGSRVDKYSGIYTGENCFGEEKVTRFDEAGYQREAIEAFYSDSYSDTPLAELAKEAFLVKGEVCYPW